MGIEPTYPLTQKVHRILSPVIKSIKNAILSLDGVFNCNIKWGKI